MNRITLLILGVAFSLLLFGCGGTSNPVTSPVDDGVRTVDWHYEGDVVDFGPITETLWFGIGTNPDLTNAIMPGGTATFWSEGTTLYIDVELDTDAYDEYWGYYMEDYWFEDMHAHWTADFDDENDWPVVPMTGGKNKAPKMGKFMFEYLFDTPAEGEMGLTEFTWVIEDGWDPTMWDCEQLAYFVYHLTVAKWIWVDTSYYDDEGNYIEQGEWDTTDYTGFGGDEPDVYAERWWTWFDFEIPCDECVIDLPPNPAGSFVPNTSGSGDHYWKFEFNNVPDGYDLDDGVYYGWCVDTDVFMTPGGTYTAVVYDPLHDTLPDMFKDTNWGAVNFVLNNWQDYVCGPNNPMTWSNAQIAIWKIVCNDFSTNGLGPYDKACGEALANNAVMYHSDFVPAEGEITAILLYGGEAYQSNIFEMVIDCVE